MSEEMCYGKHIEPSRDMGGEVEENQHSKKCTSQLMNQKNERSEWRNVRWEMYQSKHKREGRKKKTSLAKGCSTQHTYQTPDPFYSKGNNRMHTILTEITPCQNHTVDHF
jgi:hypothetical protein